MSYLVESFYSSDSTEWYTPEPFVKAARRVMNGIELDPASCKLANQVVQADRYFTKDDDGLAQEWRARSVFVNPPYGRVGTDRQKGQTELWVNKLLTEYANGNVKQAVLLVNAYLYAQWFALLWQFPICFPTGRMSFWNAQGEHGRSPHSSAIVYFGNQQQRYVDEFSQFGPVVHVWQPTSQRVCQSSLWEVADGVGTQP